MSSASFLENSSTSQKDTMSSRFEKLQKRTHDCIDHHDKLQQLNQHEEDQMQRIILSRATEKIKNNEGGGSGAKLKSSQVCVKPNGYYNGIGGNTQMYQSEIRIPEPKLTDKEDPYRKYQNVANNKSFQNYPENRGNGMFNTNYNRRTSDYHSNGEQFQTPASFTNNLHISSSESNPASNCPENVKTIQPTITSAASLSSTSQNQQISVNEPLPVLTAKDISGVLPSLDDSISSKVKIEANQTSDKIENKASTNIPHNTATNPEMFLPTQNLTTNQNIITTQSAALINQAQHQAALNGMNNTTAALSSSTSSFPYSHNYPHNFTYQDLQKIQYQRYLMNQNIQAGQNYYNTQMQVNLLAYQQQNLANPTVTQPSSQGFFGQYQQQERQSNPEK